MFLVSLSGNNYCYLSLFCLTGLSTSQLSVLIVDSCMVEGAAVVSRSTGHSPTTQRWPLSPLLSSTCLSFHRYSLCSFLIVGASFSKLLSDSLERQAATAGQVSLHCLHWTALHCPPLHYHPPNCTLHCALPSTTLHCTSLPSAALLCALLDGPLYQASWSMNSISNYSSCCSDCLLGRHSPVHLPRVRV